MSTPKDWFMPSTVVFSRSLLLWILWENRFPASLQKSRFLIECHFPTRKKERINRKLIILEAQQKWNVTLKWTLCWRMGKRIYSSVSIVKQNIFEGEQCQIWCCWTHYLYLHFVLKHLLFHIIRHLPFSTFSIRIAISGSKQHTQKIMFVNCE